MIYLLGLSFWWLRDVLLPAALVGGAACLVWLSVGTLLWRGRPRLRVRGLWVLLLACLGWMVVGTRDVLFRFDHPQFEMFRSYVADPIPADVQDLEVDSGAPAAFFQGALLRFRAPASVRRAILQHGLPGGTTRRQAEVLAERLGRNPRVTGRICTAQGGYLPYDPQTFSGYDRPEWAFVLDRLERGADEPSLPPAPSDHDLFVYAERGDWGTLVCIARMRRDTGELRLLIVPTPAPPRR
jgi:hypothetical protein